VPTADGKGRVACCEILVMTGRVHDMILDPKLTGQLPEVIAEGSYYGMQTFDQHLLQHLHAGRITMEAAMRVATSPHDFKLMVAASSKPIEGAEATVSTPVSHEPPAPPAYESPAPPAYESSPAPPAHEPAPYESPAPPSYEPPPVGSEPPPSAPPPGVRF